MAQQKIIVRQLRDFGQTFNDTFAFIRQNLRNLLKIFLAICGIFMLLHAIVQAFYNHDQFSVFDRLSEGIFERRGFAQQFNLEYFLSTFLFMILFVAMQVVIAAYMKIYDEKGGEQPTLEEVWKKFSEKFLVCTAYSIPKFLLIIVGAVFCLLPGIYFWAVLTPFVGVLVAEDGSFSEAFNRCFYLVRDNFWPSFAIYLVAYIVYYAATGVVGLIVGLIFGVGAYFTTREISSTVVVVTSVISVFSYIFYLVFYVAVMFNYFNLVEKADGTGLLNRIEKMGSDDQPTFDNTGEY